MINEHRTGFMMEMDIMLGRFSAGEITPEQMAMGASCWLDRFIEHYGIVDGRQEPKKPESEKAQAPLIVPEGSYHSGGNPCAGGHVFYWAGAGTDGRIPAGIVCACGATVSHYETCGVCGQEKFEPRINK